MKKLVSMLLALLMVCAALPVLADADTTDRAETLREYFLEKANEVEVTDTSVIFTDAVSETPLEIAKNPQKPAVLYGSFVTLWYEAGGVAAGVIGGDSSIELYNLYIGRDVTQDEGVTVLAESSAGKNWNTETIIAFQPDLIICSTAMSGYKTISAPAEAAGIPVVAMSYNDFSDYLKWFKVFCTLNGQPELWDTVAYALRWIRWLTCSAAYPPIRRTRPRYSRCSPQPRITSPLTPPPTLGRRRSARWAPSTYPTRTPIPMRTASRSTLSPYTRPIPI